MSLRHLLVLVVILAAFGLRLHNLGAKSFWYDELRQIEVSSLPLDQIGLGLSRHAARPLDYWLTRWTLMAGSQEFWLRFPAALVGTFTVAFVYRLGRELLGGRMGLAAATLLAISAYHVSFSQELRPYAEYALAGALSYWCLWKGFRGQGPRWWAGHALFSVAGVLAHYFTVFILAGQMVFVIIALLARWGAWRRAWPFLISLAIASTVLVASANTTSLRVYGLGFLATLSDPGTIATEGTPLGATARVAPDMDREFLFGRVLPAFGPGQGWGLVVYNALAGIGALRLLVGRKRRRALAMLLITWLIAGPFLILSFLSFRNAIYGNRYLLFALPPYLMLVAAGLISAGDVLYALIWRPHSRPFRFAVTLGLGMALVLQVTRQLALLYSTPKDDWRRVGEFLRANFQPGDVIVAPDVAAFVAFYFPEERGALVWSLDPGEIETAYSNNLRTWFVLSAYNTLDLTILKEQIRALPGVDFELDPLIQVRYFRLGVPQTRMETDALEFDVPPPSLAPE